jgi:mono/diheme cytochrome c family protein
MKYALLAAAMLPGLAAAQERVGDFALIDQDGYHHSMSYLDDHEAVAFLVQTVDSAATEAALPAFTALKADFDAKGVEFLMINPMGLENRAAVAAEVAEYGVDIPVLMDDHRLISEAMGISHAGQVLIFDPSRFTVQYRGNVDGAETALTEILAGDDVSTPEIAVTGTEITYDEIPVPSYVADIAPVLAEQCAACHREGGVAPFAMDSHAMVQGWSPMIREVLMTKRMPPGAIDGHIGQFMNDRLIEEQDVRNIIAWAEAGAPKDGDEDPLTQLTWPETKWAYGEPDMILDIPATTVPATGNGVFVNVEVVFDMPEDRWMKGSQIIAGDRAVLHHTVNRLDFPGDEPRRGFLGGSGNPDKANIAAYIPGFIQEMNPPDTGGLIKAGSVLHLNMHYTPYGKETTDNSQVGVWFYPEDEPPSERMSGQCACIFPFNWTDIPPNDPAFEQVQTISIDQEAHLYSFTPHMHFRGKYMRFYADYPDGTTEELINVAKYNYNWQLSYLYKEPKLVPAGTEIRVVGAFDNSTQNPANPDPERTVPWGNESWDEMFFGVVNYKFTNQGGDD